VFSLAPWLHSLSGSSILNLLENLARLGYQIKVILPSTSNKLIRRGSLSIIGLKVKKLSSISTLFSVSLWKYLLKVLFENMPNLIIFDYWTLPLFLLAKILYKSEGILIVTSRPVGRKGFMAIIFSLHFRLSLMIAKPFVKTYFSIGTLGLGRLGNIPEYKIIDVPPPLGEQFIKFNSHICEDRLRLKLGLDILLKKKVLLYHGILHEQRGILEFLEVFATSFKGDNETTLLVIGDGPAKDSVKNFIQNKKIKNIVFHESVPYSNMPEIIEASDIGLVLLSDHYQWRYQCPTKLIELLAMGKPIIASDLPGIRWITENSNSVVYLKTLTVSNFKEAVREALIKRDIKVHQEMIDRFSSYSIALRLNKVVSNCCERND